MTEPGSETAPSLTAGDTRGTEGDSAPAVAPLESGSTVTREVVEVNPNGKPGEGRRGGGRRRGEDRREGVMRDSAAHANTIRVFVVFSRVYPLAV